MVEASQVHQDEGLNDSQRVAGADVHVFGLDGFDGQWVGFHDEVVGQVVDGGAGDFDGGVVLLCVVDDGVDEVGVAGVAVFDDEELLYVGEFAQGGVGVAVEG